MDQKLLNQLQTLAMLNLPPDVVRELIEHDKWKLKEKHRHEKEMKLLSPAGVHQQNSQIEPQNDTFNEDTSYGQCDSSHIGSLAKTKVSSGALIKAKEIENPEDLPLQLISLILTISWCGERMGKWPQAKDAKSAISLRDDFSKAVERHGALKTMKAVNLVSDNLPIWDPRIILEQLSEVSEEYEKIKTTSISGSPLFVEFRKKYPHIDPESFDKCYENHRENFVESAIYMLRREFRNNPPSDIPNTDGWQQRWQQYLPTYLKQWQKDLKTMESRMRIAQRAWKESIS